MRSATGVYEVTTPVSIIAVEAFSVQPAGKIGGKTQHALCSTTLKDAVAAMAEVLEKHQIEGVKRNCGVAEKTQTLGDDVQPCQTVPPSFHAAAGNPAAAGC